MSILTKQDLRKILDLIENGYELVGGARVTDPPEGRSIILEGLKQFAHARVLIEDAMARMDVTGSLTLSDVTLTDEVILHIAHQYDLKYAEVADLPLGALERHQQACNAVRKTMRHYLHTGAFRYYKDIEAFERTLGPRNVLPFHREG